MFASCNWKCKIFDVGLIIWTLVELPSYQRRRWFPTFSLSVPFSILRISSGNASVVLSVWHHTCTSKATNTKGLNDTKLFDQWRWSKTNAICFSSWQYPLNKASIALGSCILQRDVNLFKIMFSVAFRWTSFILSLHRQNVRTRSEEDEF